MSELLNANPIIHEVEKTVRRDRNLAEFISSTQDDPFDALEIFELVRSIKDPEHPNTLEELGVVEKSKISIDEVPTGDRSVITYITLHFTPTVPHCSMAALIGLCIRVKLMRTLPQAFKVKIYVTEGTHNQEESVNKQINDKERVAAALENPNLLRLINTCLSFKNDF